MPSEGLTRGGIIENEREKIKLAQLHGDLDAIGIIQSRLELGLITSANRDRVEWLQARGMTVAVTFEGKKHLWNMLSRLTSRVETAIISNRDLQRELIHLAAKGRKAHD